MLKRIRTIAMILICFSIILYGVVTINNKIASNVKSQKAIYALFTLKPLNFNVNVGNYTIYLDGKVITTMETPIINLGENIKNKFEEVTKNVLARISHIYK